MKHDYAILTDKGTKTHNEDNLSVEVNQDSVCLMVADGLGGHGNGQIASAVAIKTCQEYFFCAVGFSGNIASFFEKCQKKLLEVHTEKQISGALTTLNIVVIDTKFLYWGHIGDTRTYIFRKNKLLRRTFDHSVPQMLVSLKQLREDEIRHHEDRCRLLKALGANWINDKNYTVEKKIRYKKGDAILLCTDGFWEFIDEDNMIDKLKQATSAENWLTQMKDIVVRNGEGLEMDNFSAITLLIN